MIYQIVKIIATVVVRSFFREISILNKERIPLHGPVIFVGNHNNQFVDASMLIAMIPRQIRFLIAEKSLSLRVIGSLAKAIRCIAVARPTDKTFKGLGTVNYDLSANRVNGFNSRFTLDFNPGDRIRLNNFTEELIVKEIISDTNILVTHKFNEFQSEPDCNNKISESSLKNDFKKTEYFVIPRLNQADVYENATNALISNDCLGIFPEGGSHDQLKLLPLKPGVAIIALSAAAAGADNVVILPMGLIYYQAQKMLSRAIVHVGEPILVDDEMILLYQGNRKKAISLLMHKIEQNLKSCTISAPDYRTIKLIRLCITLYIPENQYLSADQYYNLYHVFSCMFTSYSQNSQFEKFQTDLIYYSSLLKSYGIEEHEVRSLDQTTGEAIWNLIKLLLFMLMTAMIGIIPSILWGPLRIASSILAEKHRKNSLARSTVKLNGRDVVASYKILTLIILIPLANTFYGILLGMLLGIKIFENPVLTIILTVICCILFLPIVYYFSLRYFQKLPAIFRKCRFLSLVILCRINARRRHEEEIILCRMQLKLALRQLVAFTASKYPNFPMEKIAHCVPNLLCMMDSKRIQRRLESGEILPISRTRVLECREEIL